jgi:hypothetical protein
VSPSIYIREFQLVRFSIIDGNLVGFTDSRKEEKTVARYSSSRNRSCREVRRYIFCTKYTRVMQNGRERRRYFWARKRRTSWVRSLKISKRQSIGIKYGER